MITSGWILPNGNSISCSSCSTINGHVAAVREYLKLQDVIKIEDLEKLIREKCNYSLDDFAVRRLGWIKVIDYPYKFVFYSGSEKLDLIRFYERYGYTIVEV